MLRVFTLFLGLLFAISAQAAIKLDTMRVGDRIYTNVTITSFSTTDVYFSHNKGVANAKLRNIEPSVQKLLGYDPSVAEVAERAQEQADQRYEGTLAAAIAARPKKPLTPEVEEHFADPISDRSLLGKQAPALDFEKWLTDRPDYDGKFVLVTFWSTRSQASRKWIPQFNGWQKKFKDKLQVIAVSSEPEADVQGLTTPKIEVASALDSKGKLANTLGLTTVPSVLLADPKGTILYYGHPAAVTELLLQAAFAKPVE